VNRARLIRLARFAVCGLLLAIIFHVIFCNEVQLQLAGEGLDWEKYSKWEKRRLAWTRGPAALWETVHQLNPSHLAVAFAACGALIVLGGLRWREVLRAQGFELSRSQVMCISFVAHFFNAFLLGTAGGDVVKAWYAARTTPDKKAEAALTVFADRLLGTLALLLFTAVLMLPSYALLRDYRRHLALALAVLAMLVVAGGLVVIGFYTSALQHDGWLSRWVKRLPRGESFARGLAVCRRFGHEPAFMLRVGLWSLLLNLAMALAYWVLAQGLGIEISLARLAYVTSAVVCVAALPVTPSGLGVRENLFVWLLAVPALNVKPGAALSLSLLGYTLNLVWSAVGGLVYLFMPDRADAAAIRSAAD
jgi:glycosyltransferase 2 family protein